MLWEHKESFVNRMRDEVQGAAGVLFLDFTGLTVAEANRLRHRVREGGFQYEVVKNTLMRRAIAETTYEAASQWLKGTPTGVLIGHEDPVAAAKIAFEMLKETPNLKVKGGILDKAPINAQQAEDLSKMPSREELQAQVVQLALSPGRNVAAQIKNPAGRIVGAIDQLVEKLEAQG